MCGRFALRKPQPVINQFKTEEFRPRFNMALYEVNTDAKEGMGVSYSDKKIM